MTEEEFVARARQFFVDVAGIPPDQLDPDTDLVASGVMDSLLLVAFLAFVEDIRGEELDIDPERVQALSTVRSAYTLV